MVFVTVGNALQGFRRLLDAVETVAQKGLFGSEPVLIQSGHDAGFKSRSCEVRQFVPMDEFNALMEHADLIICHGGCTQVQAIRLGKVPVVMPRRHKYGEHVNDHQLQLVEALASENRIVPAFEGDQLESAILKARRLNREATPPPKTPMLSLVAQAISELGR